MRTLSIFSLLLATLLVSCSKEEVQVSEVVFQEIPIDQTGTGWSFFDSPGDNTTYKGEIVEDGAPGNYVIKISNDELDTQNFAAWRHSIENPDIPVGDEVFPAVKLKLENVNGSLSLVLRGDNRERQEMVFFETTQGNTSIQGTTDGYVEYRIPKLASFPEDVDILTFFVLMLPRTTGTVYIDDPKIMRKPN